MSTAQRQRQAGDPCRRRAQESTPVAFVAHVPVPPTDLRSRPATVPREAWYSLCASRCRAAAFRFQSPAPSLREPPQSGGHRGRRCRRGRRRNRDRHPQRRPQPGRAPEHTTPAKARRPPARHPQDPARVVIMQENRSFDPYFGTFPGRRRHPDGRTACRPCCVPDPQPAVRSAVPRHASTATSAVPTTPSAAIADINGGQHERLRRSAGDAQRHTSARTATIPTCTAASDGHARRDGLPRPPARSRTTGRYAQNFVLQDHMFEPTTVWSLPAHLFMVSGWSAHAAIAHDPMSCTRRSAPWAAGRRPAGRRPTSPGPT